MNLSEAITKHTYRVRDVIDLQNQLGKQPSKGREPDLWAEPPISLALVLPFIKNILAYDVFNLKEVVPEYPADLKYATGEKTKGTVRKVDYALVRGDQPLVIIECKSREGPPDDLAGTILRAFKDMQAYFTAVRSARIAIYTNGIKYIFFGDCEEEGTLDKEPFLTLDWRSPLTIKEVEGLTALVDCLRSDPAPGALRKRACEIKRKQLV